VKAVLCLGSETLKHLLICAAALAMAAPAASFADPVTVSYRGLDLNNPGDAARMLHRLDAAATEACGASRGSLREYRLTVERSTCHRASMARALEALDAPSVTALYDERTPATAQDD
jgi:UrcA family protein